MPDLSPKKIYGDATDYFNLSGIQPVLKVFVSLSKNHSVTTGLKPLSYKSKFSSIRKTSSAFAA